jgi:cytochrome P450
MSLRLVDKASTIQNIGVFLVTSLVILTLLRRALLPKPIPGIKYKKESAQRILGDAPDLLKWRSETKEMWSYVAKLAVELNTPIFQMFMRPLGKPWVVIADFREAEDIQIRRQGEFDRSAFLGEVFGPLLPHNHVWMPSDARFRAHRQLLRDTMSPGFLYGVTAPAIHSATRKLLDLWRRKAELARGKPFRAGQDIIRGLVDVILLATYGLEVGASQSQMDALDDLTSAKEPLDTDAPMQFPLVPEVPAYKAVRDLVDSIQIGMSSLFPRQHLTFALKFYPYLASARKYVDALMTRKLKDSWAKFSTNSGAEDRIQSAMDLLVQREASIAQKEGRPVAYDTPAIRDELFGFFAAGHETTSTTMQWALKHLTKHQDVQQLLYNALRTSHGDAAAANRLPTATEIINTNVPYLDAFIEENHRMGTAIPTVIRMTTREALVLGHRIPKGTDVFMIMNGPGFQRPALSVDESKRSESCQAAKQRYGTWDDSDVAAFEPKRFLSMDEKGKPLFNARAGPVLPYGAGLRGCFGIKLATLELRLIITLIVWTFELLLTPDSLSSFAGDDVNTHRPQQTFLRLKERS